MHSSNSSVVLSSVRALILWGMSLLAGSTVLTHGYQLLGLSFRAYAYTLAIFLVILTSAFLFTQIRRKGVELTVEDRRALTGLVALCLTGVLVATFSYRPDPDDYYYAPNAVYYLQHPGATMGFEIHFIDSQTRITSLSWGTSLPYEYARAAFAYLTGIRFLSVYYFVTAGVVGGLIPLAHFYLLRQFTDNTFRAIGGTFVSLSILLFMTDTHRTPGNFAFVRAFQGKALLLSAGIPILAGATIEFFQRRSLRTWVLLFSTITGLIGASASAAVILPALGSVVGLALLFQQENLKEVAVCAFQYGLSFAYSLSYAACIFLYSYKKLGPESPVNEGWPTTFLGHMDLFVNTSRPFTPLVITVGTLLSIFYINRRNNVFLWWIILSLFIYLNPFTSELHINYVTSPNIYWRMIYVYPTVVVVGSIGFLGFSWLRSYDRKVQGAIMGAVIVALVAVYIPLQSKLQWFPLQYPIRDDYHAAKQIVEEVPRGAMLSPPSLSGPIAMISSEHPQTRVRSKGVLLWLGRERGQRRIDASNYVANSGGTLQSLRKVIQKRSVCSVVFSERVADRSRVRSALSSAGYKKGPGTGEYVAYSRPSEHYDACDSASGPHRPID